MMRFFKKIMPIVYRRTLMVVLGTLLSFLILEAGIRLGGFFFKSIQDYENWRAIKKKGTYRILCIGESTTQNQYPELLERILNERNIGMRFSVIDKGRTLANTQTLLNHVDAQLAEYRPNMVIAMMGINDRKVKYYQDISTIRTWFFQYCRSYQLFQMLWMNFSKKVANDRIAGGKKAVKNLNEATSKNASLIFNRANDFLRSGKSFAKQGDFALADNFFRQALKIDEYNDQAFSELGWINSKQGEHELAEYFFKLALSLNSQNDNAYTGLGVTYFSLRKNDLAEDCFKKALVLNPQNDRAVYGMGQVYRDRGESSQAESFYREALELNPENYATRLTLAQIYRRRGEFLQARDLLEKATGLSPTMNERRLRALASIEEESGKAAFGMQHAVKVAAEDRDYSDMTINNYRKLKGILSRKGVKLVCVQYPMCHVEQLEKIFSGNEDVIFVDNEGLFRRAVKKEGYSEYFADMFAGDFGHCTKKGNELLAQNIADVIIKEVFYIK